MNGFFFWKKEEANAFERTDNNNSAIQNKKIEEFEIGSITGQAQLCVYLIIFLYSQSYHGIYILLFQ